MTSEFAQDGTVIWETLAEPGHGFAQAVARRRALSVVALCTALSLFATGLVLPRIDREAVAGDALRLDMTPHEREQAVETAGNLFQVKTWASAALGPGATAFLVTLALWLGFWVAGAKTGFKTSFTVAAHALVPQALKAVLLVPAALVHAPVAPQALPQLLPSSLAALLPVSLQVPPAAAAALGAIDLFTLWTVALLGSGMKKASGASAARTWAVVLILLAAYVALFKVVPAAGGLGPRGAP